MPVLKSLVLKFKIMIWLIKIHVIEFFTTDEDEDEVEVVENDQFYDVKSSPKMQKSKHLGKLAPHPPISIHPELSSLPGMSKYGAHRYRLFSRHNEGVRLGP